MQTDTYTTQGNDHNLSTTMVTLLDKLNTYTEENGNEPSSAYAPLTVYRFEAPTERTSYTQEPAVCLIAQGHKRVLLGDEEFFYNKDNYLITSVNLPVVAQILEASQEWISGAEGQKFAQVITEFTAELQELGPNPLGGQK